jgi:hypothetical protein
LAESTPGLHPAQNRALRELYAGARQLAGHWPRLATRLDGSPGSSELETGGAAARELLAELAEVTAGYRLHGSPAAQGVGAGVASLRNSLGDRTLERNQALRMAVLDVQHVVTLLSYCAGLARAQGDERLAEFCGRWERRLKRMESRLRRAVSDLAREPDRAIHPLDRSPLGRAGQRAAWALGALGELTDRRAARRGGRAGPAA